ncbi:MAG: class I tRNA ligase family protein [Nitrososphaerales archaeon]|nr:class I tRNA ligase family protein [Nitrososphaerales archaeon]
MVTKLARRPSRRQALDARYDWKAVETRVREFYDRTDPRKQVEKKLSNKKPVGWVEGPPTLNNQPHIGHIRGRVYKDLWYRYTSMNGERLVFRGGWDTQGLPVELDAEKALGLSGNKWQNLNVVGIEKLVQACKDLIRRYRAVWEESDRLLGIPLDRERAYMTYRDAFIEREWKYLETAWKTGLLGEGYKVVAYCPSCQTALSHAEVALGGYEQLEDPSLYYKVKAGDGSFLVIWTTMPFTVVTDELVAVKPEADYEFVTVGGETWVVCSERKAQMAKDLGIRFGETRRRVKGKELAGVTYTHPLIEQIPGLRKAEYSGKVHRVVPEEFVDTTTGTGLVHLSPANGEDDFAVAQAVGVPVFAPFDDQVRFTAEAGEFAGLFARDADQNVISALEARGAVVHAGRITHDYPVCWRSGHRIVWLARREYFYWIDKIRTRLIRAAEKVEYYFEAPRNRFLESIRDSPPWGITRERVWGTPLPIWVCADCGAKVPAFSRRRIVRLARALPDGPKFELHRPWIDRVVLNCPECGGAANREPFVLDTWHNSGSAPYAAFSDTEYRELFPVRHLTEGIDQTRAWAYTLLVLNVLLTGKPLAPYKAFLFQGHVLNEKGEKMSKSEGNAVWGLDVLKAYSTDLTRLYLTWKSAPEDSLSMDLKEMAARPYQILNTLYHLHVYLTQNGPLDGYEGSKHTLAWAKKRRLLTKVDRWFLAKLDSAEKAVRHEYASARYNEVCRSLEDLIIMHASQTYVRLVRGDLWKDDPKERNRRLAIYAVLGHVLRRADLMLHPVAPFITEYLFQETFARPRKWKQSMVTERFPERAPSSGGRGAERAVEFALTVEEACNSARMKAKLKRRWPLRQMVILVPRRETSRASGGLVASLCNVKDVGATANVTSFPASFSLIPNRAKVSAQFKEKTAEILGALPQLAGQKAISAYVSGKPLKTRAGGRIVEVPLDVLELVTKPASGFEVGERRGVFVAVATARDDVLVAEGLARDVARRLQALRKARAYPPTKVLARASVAGLEEEELRMLEPLKKELAFLVRVRGVTLSSAKGEGNWSEDDLDGRPIYLDVG